MEEKELVQFRQLALVKQIFLHGIEHSQYAGAINKMIAVHNLHNAIELMLRSILYKYNANIRVEDSFPKLMDKIETTTGTSLPYRREILMLNQERNHVQHYAVEPEDSLMEQWRVFIKSFLCESMQIYYDLDFNGINQYDLINDTAIKTIIKKSAEELASGELQSSLELSSIAFLYGAKCVWDHILFKDGYMIDPASVGFHRAGQLISKAILDTTRTTQYYSAILATGIRLYDLSRFNSLTPSVVFL